MMLAKNNTAALFYIISRLVFLSQVSARLVRSCSTSRVSAPSACTCYSMVSCLAQCVEAAPALLWRARGRGRGSRLCGGVACRGMDPEDIALEFDLACEEEARAEEARAEAECAAGEDLHAFLCEGDAEPPQAAATAPAAATEPAQCSLPVLLAVSGMLR
jgi:hypothetical protein